MNLRLVHHLSCVLETHQQLWPIPKIRDPLLRKAKSQRIADKNLKHLKRPLLRRSRRNRVTELR